MTTSLWRSRWAAVGAAIAITLGAGGIGLVQATTSTGEKPIYKPINPCRLADTRPAPFTVGPRTSPIGPAESYTLSGWGAVGECNLPTDTTGLALNVTALDQSAATFLTLYPTGEPLPNASHLNPTPGEPPTPNAVNIDLNAAGQFDVYNQFGSVNVIIDVVGYYDDHNHDDRYYTEAEVDAKVQAAKSTTVYAGGNQQVSLTSTDTVVRSVSLVAPSAGKVIVNSAGYLWMPSGATAIARCSITTDTTVDGTAMQYMEVHGSPNDSDVLGGTRGFDVSAGQSLTVNLVCDEFSGQANVSDTWLTAIFVPN